MGEDQIGVTLLVAPIAQATSIPAGGCGCVCQSFTQTLPNAGFSTPISFRRAHRFTPGAGVGPRHSGTGENDPHHAEGHRHRLRPTRHAFSLRACRTVTVMTTRQDHPFAPSATGADSGHGPWQPADLP